MGKDFAGHGLIDQQLNISTTTPLFQLGARLQ
jgi:hypothetical protein